MEAIKAKKRKNAGVPRGEACNFYYAGINNMLIRSGGDGVGDNDAARVIKHCLDCFHRDTGVTKRRLLMLFLSEGMRAHPTYGVMYEKYLRELGESKRRR